MKRGYIRIFRRCVDNPLFKKPLVWHCFNYFLLRANHSDKEIDFNGSPLLIKRGSFLTSLNHIVKDTGLSKQNVRTAIKNLKNHKMIEFSTQELTQQATIVQVLNYEQYQSKKDEPNTVTNTDLTQSQHSANTKQRTTKNDKEYSEDSKEFRLSLFLFNQIRKRKPDYKMPDLQNWSIQSDYILRIDKRDPKEIKEVVEWCQSDEFWQDNILSTAKLRKQYDKLVMKMNKESGKAKPSDLDGSELAAKKLEETRRLIANG